VASTVPVARHVLCPFLLDDMARGTGRAQLEVNFDAIRGNVASATRIAQAW
jgi:pseudouridine-5'-phosphate glycosidase